MTPRNLGERIAYVLQEKGLPQAELAKKLNVRPQTVNYLITSGATRSKLVPELAKALAVTEDWLLYGTGQQIDATAHAKVKGNRIIPILNYVQAGSPQDVVDQFQPGQGMDELITDQPIGKHSFALTVRGDSMSPLMKEGDRVIVDPDLQWTPGDIVVAKINGDEATLKKIRSLGYKDGRPLIELVPANPDYPTVRSEDMPVSIVGPVVEHRSYRRRPI